MKVLTATRKIASIQVVQVTEDSLKELIESEILNELGSAVDSKKSKNPQRVNMGDYLKVDDMYNISPISQAYFDEHYMIVE